MTEYARICYEFGGETHCRWADEDTLTGKRNGGLGFDDLETGCRKELSAQIPVVLTHGVDLPPDVVPWNTED